MIIDIVTSLIVLALGTIAANVANVALSVVSLGTTLAAGVAEVFAEALGSACGLPEGAGPVKSRTLGKL